MKVGAHYKLKQLRFIVISWVLFGFIMAVYDHLVLRSSYSLGTSEQYSFLISAARNMGGGLIGALLGGSVLVFYVNVTYREKPYGQTILFVSISFLLIMVFITCVMALILVPVQTNKPLSDPASVSEFIDFVTGSFPLKSALVWSLVVAITQLMLQLNSKFGPGTFGAIIKGKYHIPKAEERIFMFLDLNSSTTIAERLGAETYHRLLRDFFADLTNPILENKGSIYQYVGDEVVVSWEYESGIQNATCINCFFDMKDQIRKQSQKYLDRYGLIPSFKAGIHCGKVIAGEVGIVKRDITYSGDVLNTTSRIQSLCREFNEEIIASADVVDSLLAEKKFSIKALGSIKLRGKEKELFLSSVKLT